LDTVIARLSTNVFCVKQYRIISGMQQYRTPMEIIWRERAGSTV
jgi:hypothetical protein